MSLLAKMRSAQARWGRPTLVLLTFAWLNVILQPCAMAMAGGSAGCHHASSAHAHEIAGHDAMAGHAHAMLEHAPDGDHEDAPAHEMDSGCMDCVGELADCANVDDVNKSDREEQFTPEHGPAWLVPLPCESALPDNFGSSPLFRAIDAARLAGAFPPLNVQFCVYLD